MLDSYLAIAQHPFLWVFIGLTVMLYAIQAVTVRMDTGGKQKTPLLDRITNPALRMLALFAMLLAPIWVMLLLTVLWSLFGIVITLPEFSESKDTELRWHVLSMVGLITAFGGIFGAPLALIRVFTTERQTKASEEGLITDRINKAVEGLGAEKEVNRHGRTVVYEHNEQRLYLFEWKNKPISVPDGAKLIEHDDSVWATYSLTEPNLEVRIGAIFALERIAQDSDRDHVQIMEILCAYIRQNAPARDAAP